MQSAQPFFARDDTIFGVCHALGEDFGFNPDFLRIAFAVAVYFNPTATIAVYFGLFVFIAAIRFFVPNPRVAAAEQAETSRQGEVERAPEQMELAIAA